MIKINTNPSFISEKNYIFDFIFSKILGLRFTLEFTYSELYSFHFDKNSFSFPDIFFSKIYQKKSNLEFHKYSFENKDFLKNNLIPEKNFLTFLQKHKSKPVKINGPNLTFHFDLIGTCFFLLSRYEETNPGTTDKHKRFSFRDSVAYKLGFADRPLVDEYVEFLWNLIKSNNPSLERKSKQFSYHVSHDIDRPVYKLNKVTNKKEYLLSNFENILETEKKFKIKSTFFFMSQVTERQIDVGYSIHASQIKKIFRLIHDSGSQIGLHGSYHSYNDSEQIKKEFCILRNACSELGIKQEQWSSRQHYLRFDVNHTHSALDVAGVDYDCTLGFPDQPSFRSGTCHPHPVFDFEQRKTLKIISLPLIVMDVSLFNPRYLGFDLESQEILNYVQTFIDKCRKYNGTFSLLYHDNYLAKEEHLNFYEKILATVSS